MQSGIVISPEVTDLLGGPAAVDDLLRRLTGAYPCAGCGRTLRIDTDRPVTVIVVVPAGGGRPSRVLLAHAGCAGSDVWAGEASTCAAEPTAGMAAAALLRSAQPGPAAALLLAPRHSPSRSTPGGDTVDETLAGLLSCGFALLTHPDAGLPHLAELTFDLAGDRVTVSGPYRTVVWDHAVVADDAWFATVAGTGRLALVVACGIGLAAADEPEQAFGRAVAAGRAVGAVVGRAVTGDDHRTAHRERPDPNGGHPGR